MTKYINTFPQHFLSDGAPAAFFKVFFGLPNTDPKINPKVVFSDKALTVSLGAEITLDATGSYGIDVFLNDSYSIRIETPLGSLFRESPEIFGLFDAAASENFTTVADMVTNGTALKLGDFVSLREHTTGNKSGVLPGEVVAAGTGTANNGSFIDLPNTTPPLQWKQDFPLDITLEMFGAGSGNDFTDISSAVTFMASLGGGLLHAKNQTFSIGANTLVLTGEVQIQGMGLRDTIITGSATPVIRLGGLSCGLKDLMVVATGASTRVVEIHSIVSDTGNISAYNEIARVWIDGNSKAAHGLYMDATDAKPNLWNFIDTVVIRNCNSAIVMEANDVTNSLTSYNNSNHFQNINVHTINIGIQMLGTGPGGVGDCKENIFDNYQIGAASDHEIDFGTGNTDRNIWSGYGSFDFTGTKRIEDAFSAEMGGNIIQGNGGNIFYAMPAGDNAVIPIQVRRNDSAGSIFHKFQNTAKIISIGINAGLSGSPFEIGGDAQISGFARITGALDHEGSTAGFFGTAPIAKQTVIGSRGGNVALQSLLEKLNALGILTDNSTA